MYNRRARSPVANGEERKSSIYADILIKIMSGTFAPGSRLVEEDLAEAYHVSRTPIREILFTLERGGLVERTHNRGARVVSFTPDDVEEIYDIRNALECLSLRHAARNLPLQELMHIERRLEELERSDGPNWTQQHSKLDVELHNLIVSHSGNRRLMAYVENISLLIHWLRLIGYRDKENARRAGEQHAGIVRALLRRDADLAQRLLAEHIENSKRNALETIFRTGLRAESVAVTGDRVSP